MIEGQQNGHPDSLSGENEECGQRRQDGGHNSAMKALHGQNSHPTPNL